MPNDELAALLERTALALDEEAAWLVDVDTDDRGGSKPSVPARDRGYFDTLAEEAQSLRALAEVVKAR
mgnify:CR=1 FL=1